MKVAVVITTIGAQHLEQCIDSVLNQTHKDTVIYLFKDGLDVKIPSFVNNIPNIKQIHLDENVGKGWYGHRVYAACSFLVNADIICYLDEDNFYEPEHVQNLVETISKGNSWAYSLRNIVDKNGEFNCTDDCESLGKWDSVINDKFIDVNCFMIPKMAAIHFSPYWYRRARHPQEQPEVDRILSPFMMQNLPKFDTTGQYSVNYRVASRADSVQDSFFIKGNEVMKQKMNGEYPWRKKT